MRPINASRLPGDGRAFYLSRYKRPKLIALACQESVDLETEMRKIPTREKTASCDNRVGSQDSRARFMIILRVGT